MALTIGWVTAEDWLLDAVGLHGCDRAAVRACVDDILGSIMALGRGPGESSE